MDRQTFKNAIVTAKTELKDAVAYKVGLTRERVEYKLKTRSNVPENERLAWFHSIDSKRSDAKDRIRHLHLAYGYLRGQDYKRMESKAKHAPSAFAIACNLDKWLGAEHPNEFTIKGWIDGAASLCVRPDVSPSMRQYRSLERRLHCIRAEHGVGTPYEEPILDEMDKTWYSLTDAEHELLDGEGSTCFPEKSSEVAA